MTHREYQRCSGYYVKKYGTDSVEEKKVEPPKPDPNKPYFGPDFGPVDPIAVTKGVWAMRLRCVQGR